MPGRKDNPTKSLDSPVIREGKTGIMCEDNQLTSGGEGRPISPSTVEAKRSSALFSTTIGRKAEREKGKGKKLLKKAVLFGEGEEMEYLLEWGGSIRGGREISFIEVLDQ